MQQLIISPYNLIGFRIMSNKLVSFELAGLFGYLATRVKLRFLDNLERKTDRTLNIFGQTITLDTLDLEQKYLAVDCVREPENLIVYRAIADSGLVDIFIDIGANCGHVAASLINNYREIFLFEPNPKLAILLRKMFIKQKNITIRECAIVDKKSSGNLTLTVPDNSSGLATLGSTDLSNQHNQVHTYKVKASTLAAELEGVSLESAYIKIDVEGFEANIIQSAKELINSKRPIVGFEALSRQSAINCVQVFNDYVFYCARFDFLENGGALSRSLGGMIKALIFSGKIEIVKLGNLEESSLNNFSQVYSVPVEKAVEFEKSILIYSEKNPDFHLNNLKTWS